MTAKEARQLWVQELRSGNWRQTTGALRKTDSYCCLGVACALYADAEGEGEWTPINPGWEEYEFMGRDGVLPERVRMWLGVVSPHGDLKEPVEIGKDTAHYSLAELNDDGYTFEEIADKIENGEVQFDDA